MHKCHHHRGDGQQISGPGLLYERVGFLGCEFDLRNYGAADKKRGYQTLYVSINVIEGKGEKNATAILVRSAQGSSEAASKHHLMGDKDPSRPSAIIGRVSIDDVADIVWRNRCAQPPEQRWLFKSLKPFLHNLLEIGYPAVGFPFFGIRDKPSELRESL